MAIQYINGATADNPVIKAIETELDRMNAQRDTLSFEDRLILDYRYDTLMRIYSKFTTPFDTMVVG